MNKLLAILFGISALGAFAMSQRDNFQTQAVGYYGNPTGSVRLFSIPRPRKLALLPLEWFAWLGASTSSFAHAETICADELKSEHHLVVAFLIERIACNGAASPARAMSGVNFQDFYVFVSMVFPVPDGGNISRRCLYQQGVQLRQVR